MSDIRDHLQAIYDAHGKLTPEVVVDAARDESHPLHSRVFDRSPADAAEAYYRSRAHDLIVSVRVTYKEGDVPKTVRAFHALRTEKGHVYEPVENIATDEFSRALLLRDMEREWRQMFDRFQQFEEFLSLVGADIKRIAA